jgi:formate hydrogenlyase transcriptional activator
LTRAFLRRRKDLETSLGLDRGLAVSSVTGARAGKQVSSVEPIESGQAGASPRDRAAAWLASIDPRLQNELILQAAGEGIYGLDLDGRVTFANPAAARLTGHAVEELLGQSMHDLVHHTRVSGHPYPRHACPIYAALRDGAMHQVEDEVFWHKRGTPVPVDYTSTPIFCGGRVAGAVVVFRDVSERKEAERRLRGALDQVRRLQAQLQAENAYLQQELQRAHAVEAIIGSSGGLSRIMQEVQSVARTDATVLIQGESGTGKELVARAVHGASRRAERPLVKVNCGALPATLVASELFGHERGAFTGASARRIGRFELAQGGTLFLDEVGELPLEVQASLLRALQEREFERVGGSQTLRVDTRVIAATNRDLAALVAEGRFRQDLYFRLDVFPITLPPLRERRADIPALVAAYLARLSQQLRRPIDGVSPESLRQLVAYDWPGNVRELHNVLERAAIVSRTPLLDVCRPLAAPSARAAPSAPPAAERSDVETLRECERQHIVSALTRSNWKIAGRGGAAELLGLHANTLRSRMQRLGIAWRQTPAADALAR